MLYISSIWRKLDIFSAQRKHKNVTSTLWEIKLDSKRLERIIRESRLEEINTWDYGV